MPSYPGTETVIQSFADAVAVLGDVVPHLLWLAGPDGYPTYQNTVFREYTGVDFLDSDWREKLAHPDDAARLRDTWTLAMREGRPLDVECRFRRHDGAWRWFQDRMNPATDHEGNSLWIGTLTDVHALKVREAELSDAVRSRDEYLAALGHELRTPLQALNQALYVLKLPDLPASDAEKMHRTAEHQVLELKRFCDEVLDVNKVRWDAMSVFLEPVTVQAVVESAVTTASASIQRHGHTLDVDVSDPGAVVTIDRVRVAQALVNLLDNAAKYTDRRGRILLRAAIQGNDLELTVEDSGRGIEPGVLPHIFDLFSRGSTGPATGFGIGLALVRRVATLHGGVIEAHSAGPGQGSRFTLRIPAVPSTQS